MVRVGVFASGSGTNFENLVKYQLDNEVQYDIKLLIVDKDDAYAIKRAQLLDIPYYIIKLKDYINKEEYEKKIVKILLDNEIDLIVLAGYMKIISDYLLKKYSNRIINIHPAYLPNYPGAHGIKDAFDDNAIETGVTIHYVDSGIDTGKIIYQEKIVIEKNWSLSELEDKVHELEYKIYPTTLNQICKNLERG